MDIGKIPNEMLEGLLKSRVGKDHPDILLGPGIGRDCGVIDFGDEVCVISTDPITGAVNRAGYLSVHIACNDIATTGARPIGVMVTIMVPPVATKEDIKKIMEEANEAANELEIGILGGHTELTPAVNQGVLSVTAVGRIKKDKLVHPQKAKIGDDILITKYAGLEGTAIIALDREGALRENCSPEIIRKGAELMKHISVVKEGEIAGEFGAHVMHDATEGGVLGALWEMGQAMNKGIEVDINKIPILEETKAISKVFDINPLRLISSGSMIIVSPQGEKLKDELSKRNIPSTLIGKVIGGNESYMIEDGKRNILASPGPDELHKAF